jgi:hypothetical protein
VAGFDISKVDLSGSAFTVLVYTKMHLNGDRKDGWCVAQDGDHWGDLGISDVEPTA